MVARSRPSVAIVSRGVHARRVRRGDGFDVRRDGVWGGFRRRGRGAVRRSFRTLVSEIAGVGSAAGWVCCGLGLLRRALPFASAAAAFSFSFSLLASRAALTFAWRSVLKSRSDGIFLSFSAFRRRGAGLGGGFGGGFGGDARGGGARRGFRDAREVARVADAGLSQDAVAEPVVRRPARRHVGNREHPGIVRRGVGRGRGRGDGRGIGHGGGRGTSGTSRVEASPGRFPADVSAVVAPASFDGTPAAPAAPPEDASAADGPAADDPGAEASAPAPVPNASAPTPRAVGAPSVAAVDPADAPADASAANARI